MTKATGARAKAAWDGGFGDWESARGAASHMGRRDITEVLIEHGARPNLFTFAMLGQVDVVRAICRANPGIQRLHGPHGITLRSHARNGGAQAASVVEYLEELGGADVGQVNEPLDEQTARIYSGDYEPGGAAGSCASCGGALIPEPFFTHDTTPSRLLTGQLERPIRELCQEPPDWAFVRENGTGVLYRSAAHRETNREDAR